MREIKFRAWDKLNEEMVFVDGLRFDEHSFFNGDTIYKTVETKNGIDVLNEQGSSILMQFVGLKDRNNKDIYEGDIVKFTDDYNKIVVKYDEVEWGCVLNIINYDDDGTYFHQNIIIVIGNIYENPELLEDYN